MSLHEQISNNKRKSWLIMIVFIFILGILGYVFSLALQDGYFLFVIAIIFSIGSAGFSYYYSDKVAIAFSGAKPLDRSKDEKLFRKVENLSIGAGIVPMPQVYVIEDMAINAFATGRDPKHSAIAVTRGAINKLNDLELEGVLAHELSHINNYDIRTMSIAVVLVGVIALVSEWFLRMQWFRGRGNKNSSGLIMVFAIVGAILGPLMAQLLKMALSRQREFLADASAANLTRYPKGLASALAKIQMDATPLHHSNSATAHMYISNPMGKFGKKASNLFSTHPPVEERIKRLLSM